MKNFRFLMPLCFVLVVACGKKTTETVTVKPMPTPPSTAKDIQIAKGGGVTVPNTPRTSGKINIPEGIDPNLVVSLRRTPCFGKCPHFEIQLFADGKATYNGMNNVEMMGKYETQVSADFTKNILTQAQAIKFMGLKNRYPDSDMQISDVPTSYSYVRMGNDGKLVVNNHDAPTELIEFERFIESQFSALKWQKVKD